MKTVGRRSSRSAPAPGVAISGSSGCSSSRIRIKPQHFFYPTVSAVVAERWPINQAGAIELALQTAR
jgi:hypothetical protein